MKKTILLADDEEGIRKVLRITLADLGYDVITAADGREALRLFQQFRPAIVLTDIKMPEIDGIDLLRRLKEIDSDTEVIMITGHGDIDLAIKSIKYDATDFVTKPINDDILEIALQRGEERIALRNQLKAYTQNLEQRVQEKTGELIKAERLAAIGQTVAELSHGIKNIAGGLKGGTFVLEKGIELENREYLMQGWKMIKTNVDKIAKMSLDLLNYAKTAALNYQLCEPNQPAQEVFDLMKPRAEKTGIALHCDLCFELEAFRFDPELIHQCILNLVTNALDSCTEKDAERKEKVVFIRTVKVAGWGVEYQVTDNGCGMTSEVRERLFQNFFTTKGVHGTGIGLMLTKKIVDEHQGELEVASTPGEGARFIIRIPKKIRR